MTHFSSKIKLKKFYTERSRLVNWGDSVLSDQVQSLLMTGSGRKQFLQV